MAYYQTLYATATGKTSAVAGMRSLAQRNPGDTRFAVALGTMLTYDPRTRAEGIHILQGYPKDAEAQSALRQALDVGFGKSCDGKPVAAIPEGAS